MSKSLLHFELGLKGRSTACRSIAERNDDSSLSASVRAELLCEERWCASAEWFEQTYFNCDDDWSVRWVAWERRMGEIRQGHSLGVVHELGDAADTYECAQSNAFLRDAAHVAHERFFSRPDDFLRAFGDELALLDLYGTDAPQRCWRAHCAGDAIVSGALLCALYEQAVKVAMRGTLHWAEAQIQPVPRRISLLLADPRFVSFFPETFRFWFRGIVGAPPGLNLRNVLWHGFASHGEFPARFTSLLFLFAVSSIRRFASLQLRMKDLVAACTMDVASHVQRSMCFHTTVPRTSFHEMKRALRNSFFILPRQVAILRNSLQYFEQPGCEDMALSGVFSTMEQALRRVYVFVRQSHERLLTAEDDALMTTLDTFLQDGQNPSSEFRKLIGDDAMLQLCDLFYHRDGPRLRDMLSHGVINCSSLPEFLISSVHSLVFRLLKRFSLVRELTSVPPYRPVYHPSVILAQTLRKMVHLSEAFEVFALQNALETEDQSIVDLIRACEERERRVSQLSSSFCSSSLHCLTAGSGDIVVEILWENDDRTNLQKNLYRLSKHLCVLYIRIWNVHRSLLEQQGVHRFIKFEHNSSKALNRLRASSKAVCVSLRLVCQLVVLCSMQRQLHVTESLTDGLQIMEHIVACCDALVSNGEWSKFITLMSLWMFGDAPNKNLLSHREQSKYKSKCDPFIEDVVSKGRLK